MAAISHYNIQLRVPKYERYARQLQDIHFNQNVKFDHLVGLKLLNLEEQEYNRSECSKWEVSNVPIKYHQLWAAIEQEQNKRWIIANDKNAVSDE